MAISRAEIDSSELIAKKILNDLPVLAIPKRWANDISTVKDWANICERYPASAYSRELPFLKDFQEKYQKNFQTHFYFDDWTSIEKRVHEQKSWAILPSSYIDENRGYHVIPLTTLFEAQQFYLYYRKELSKFPWMKELLSKLV